ncbi:MAG: 2TM domain-containing protein [Acidimicrobiia bacterium]|nr:2TM domain-containing protein [Acidimicrobiia bacterium]
MSQQFEPRRSRTYSREEVGDLIRTATELEHVTERHKAELRDGLTYDQLVEVASELGISEDALVRALMEKESSARSIESPKRDRGAQHRQAFLSHLWTYGSVMAGLTVIDLADGSGGLDWVWYPAAGWGIFVLIHARSRFFR